MTRATPQRQERVAVALAGGMTVNAAAQACKVSKRTVFTWLRDPAFTAHVAAARTDMRERACGRTARAMSKAAGRLEKLLDSRKESIQLQAAKALLELGIRLRDALEIEARLRAIEQRFEHDTRDAA